MANPPNIENMQPASGAGGGAGTGAGAGGAATGAGADQMATYEQSRKHLKQMLNRQADLKRQLVSPSLHSRSFVSYLPSRGSADYEGRASAWMEMM